MGVPPAKGSFAMRTTRIIALALILPVPIAAAQDGGETHRRAEAVDSESPAPQDIDQALERAAYLIEHGGKPAEVQAAVRAVKELADALEQAGEVERATAARTEIRALEMAGVGGLQGTVDDARVGIQALIERALATPAQNQEHYRIVEDLALYGDAAVPQLVAACLASRAQAQSAAGFTKSLVDIGTERSKEALRELLRSSDPLLRRDVALRLHPGRDRELLFAALEDPTASVRDQALETLGRSSDPVLASLMTELALQEEWGAIQWLVEHQPKEFFNLLGANSTPPEVRRRMISMAARVERVSIDGAALDLLLKAADGELEGVSPASSVTVILTAFQSSTREESKGLHPRALAHFLERREALAQPSTPLLLIETATPEVLPQLVSALDDYAQDFKATNLDAVISALVTFLGRLNADDFESVVAAFGRLPDPGLAAKEGTTAPARLWGAMARGMQNFDALSLRAEVMSRCLQHVQGQARQKFLEYSTAWLRAHVYHTPDHPNWYASQLDSAFEPVARALSEDVEPAMREYGQSAYGPMGDSRFLIYLHGFKGSGKAARARQTILGRDVEGARRVYEQAIDTAIEEGPETIPERLAWAADLPGRHRVELFHKYWPKLEDDGSRTALLHWLEGVSSPQATKLLAEHYDKIPDDEVDLRGELIERFGEELYEPAIPLIGKALRDPSRYVHQIAYKAFEKLRQHRSAIEEYEAWRRGTSGDPSTVDELIEMLDSENPDVVANAVKALGALRATVAYPRIVRLLERDAVQIHEAVKKVMDRLVESED